MLTKIDARDTTSYTYDSQNRLVTVTEPSGKVTSYTFDGSGNRKTQTVVLGTDTTVTTYTYDSQNRLTGTSEVLNGITTETVVYAYDNNGNQLTKTCTAYIAGVPQTPVIEQTNTYDLFNQLIRTVTSTGVTVINTYNGDGLRVGKSVNGSLTRYLYEYDKVVLEENYLGDQTGRNVYGINLITRQVGGDTLIYMYNGHADVTALLSITGLIAATYYYDAFGNILDQTGILSNNILYAGYQYDFETGLYYLNARMYDPVTARFMQEDTYTGEYNDPLSLNLYTYCKNEPIRYSDPTGHNTLDDYDYQKKAEERKTRSSNSLDNYAYQNQTRIAKDRQSKSVDDYYYNKNTSDARLKQQTMEQQRATTNTPALAAPAKAKTFFGIMASSFYSAALTNGNESVFSGYFGPFKIKDTIRQTATYNSGANESSIFSTNISTIRNNLTGEVNNSMKLGFLNVTTSTLNNGGFELGLGPVTIGISKEDEYFTLSKNSGILTATGGLGQNIIGDTEFIGKVDLNFAGLSLSNTTVVSADPKDLIKREVKLYNNAYYKLAKKTSDLAKKMNVNSGFNMGITLDTDPESFTTNCITTAAAGAVIFGIGFAYFAKDAETVAQKFFMAIPKSVLDASESQNFNKIDETNKI